MNEPAPAPGIIASLLPLLIVSLMLYAFLFSVAKRKGKSRLAALIAFVPIVNGFYALWLCSQTDEAVLKRLEALEKR